MSELRLRLPFWGGNWPVTQGFGREETDTRWLAHYRRNGLDGHEGVDFGCPTGTPIIAAHDGWVMHAGPREGYGAYGTFVVLVHGSGLGTWYCHLLDSHDLKPDRWVGVGGLVGHSGATGIVSGAHLHWGACRFRPGATGPWDRLDKDNGYKGFLDAMSLVEG